MTLELNRRMTGSHPHNEICEAARWVVNLLRVRHKEHNSRGDAPCQYCGFKHLRELLDVSGARGGRGRQGWRQMVNGPDLLASATECHATYYHRVSQQGALE
jgi:hypothetical protein